jgi:hypothetical protein
MVSSGCAVECRVKARWPLSVNVMAEIESRLGTCTSGAAMPSDVPIRPPPQVL